jgi:8-oxo-dGTP pyrophosphatase MutT (NUDIX family)
LDPPTAQIGFIPKHVLTEVLKGVPEGPFVHTEGRVGLARSLDSFQKRSDALNSLVRSWRDAGLFSDALDGWREEMYAVYSSDSHPFNSWERASQRGGGGAVFELERAACALFGLVTYGVHLTAYTQEQVSIESTSSSSSSDSSSLRVWVPRRSASKATWPSYLDNSVAGGITSGDAPFESIVRECQEEASLAEDVVRSRIQQAGVVTYVYRTLPLEEGGGYLQPEVQYIYDLPLPAPLSNSSSSSSSDNAEEAEFIPKPNDGEAQSFELLSIPQIMDLLRKGEFKPNCGLVMLDFLIRKGVISEGNEGVEGYVEMVQLLHRDLGLPMP